MSRTCSFPVYSNLIIPRIPGLEWTEIQISGDHSDYGPVQDPNIWTRLSLVIPSNATSVQLTGVPENGDLRTNSGCQLARIMSYTVDFNSELLTLSIKWWDESWILYIGWNLS